MRLVEPSYFTKQPHVIVNAAVEAVSPQQKATNKAITDLIDYYQDRFLRMVGVDEDTISDIKNDKEVEYSMGIASALRDAFGWFLFYQMNRVSNEYSSILGTFKYVSVSDEKVSPKRVQVAAWNAMVDELVKVCCENSLICDRNLVTKINTLNL